jgi:hypothetical protein
MVFIPFPPFSLYLHFSFMLNISTFILNFCVNVKHNIRELLLCASCRKDKPMKIYTYGGKRNISGTTIKELRKAQNLSQQDLAARLQIAGVSMERDSISRIENGSRFISDFELKAMAQILGTSVNHLVDFED